MELDDIPDLFPTPTGTRSEPRACRRHNWYPTPDGSERCLRCARVKDPATARRGKNNRSRGNAIERWVCHLLGISRRGQFGGPDDGGGEADWIVIQVKSGGAYPERIDALLHALPTRAGQLRAVVHTDAPGPGAKRRALITLDLYDFADHYGGKADDLA